MASQQLQKLKKFFTKKGASDDEPDVQPQPQPRTVHDKICAFNSIMAILAQIQELRPPLKDHEVPFKTPPSSDEWKHLRLSNSFALLVITNTEVVAATLYTPQALSVLAWMQDKDQSQDQDQDQDQPSSKFWDWERICWLFSTNTKNTDMRSGSMYPGPCIIGADSPEGYLEGGDPRANMLQYLDEFLKNW